MAIPAPYQLIVTMVAVVIGIVMFGAWIVAVISHFQIRACRTERATVAVRMFVPWWPWIDGMLTPEGLRYRANGARAFWVFLGCGVAMAIVIGGTQLIWGLHQ